MIVCTGCGNANETRDEFCGSCGAYLEWHGERVGNEPAPVAAPPVILPAPEKPGLIDRVRYVVGLDDDLAGNRPPGTIPTAGLPSNGLTPPGLAVPLTGPPLTGPQGPPLPGPPLTGAPPVGGPWVASASAPAPAPPAPSWPQPTPLSPGPTPGPASWPQQPGLSSWPSPAPTPLLPAPVSPAVEARAPGIEYERPNAQRPDAVDLGPADLYCGACGAGNADGRQFCRRCGVSLADAVRPARPPWWRRLFGGRAKEKAPKGGLAAGQRPDNWTKLSIPETEEQPSGTKRRWRFRLPQRIVLSRFALPLIALSVLGMGLGPMRVKATEFIFDGYHSAKRKIAPEFVHVTPKSATATDAAKDHPASAAIDRNTTSYWSDGRAGSGVGAVLTITFDRPTDLVKVGFDNGAAGKEFPFQPRLRVVEVTYLHEGKEVNRKELTLGDKPEFQTFNLLGRKVDSATVRIVSVYAGQRGSAASLAEIAFVTIQ